MPTLNMSRPLTVDEPAPPVPVMGGGVPPSATRLRTDPRQFGARAVDSYGANRFYNGTAFDTAGAQGSFDAALNDYVLKNPGAAGQQVNLFDIFNQGGVYKGPMNRGMIADHAGGYWQPDAVNGDFTGKRDGKNYWMGSVVDDMAFNERFKQGLPDLAAAQAWQQKGGGAAPAAGGFSGTVPGGGGMSYPGAGNGASFPGARKPGGSDSFGAMQGGPDWASVISGAFGGVGDGTSSSTSASGLDPRLDSLYSFALQQAMQQYAGGDNSFYGGQTVAGFDPAETQAQDWLMQMARGGGIGSGGVDYYNAALQRGVNPGQSADMDAAIEATMRDVTRQATDPGGVFSQIRGNSMANGAYGGTRQGVLEGIAMGRLADSLGRTSAEMRLGGRGQDITAAGNALGNTGAAITGATLPATLASGVGAQRRAMGQAGMDDQLRRWAYEQFEPERRLSSLFNFVGSAPLGQVSRNTSTMSPAQLTAMQNAQNGGGGGDGNSWLAALTAVPALWSLFGGGGKMAGA